MKPLHFKRYYGIMLEQYETADKRTAEAVAAFMGHKKPFDGYIINRRDIEALEQSGHIIFIK